MPTYAHAPYADEDAPALADFKHARNVNWPDLVGSYRITFDSARPTALRTW